MVAADDRGLDDRAGRVSVLGELAEVLERQLLGMGAQRLADFLPHGPVLPPHFVTHPLRQIEGRARGESINFPGRFNFFWGLGAFFIKGTRSRDIRSVA